mgnify:CR=1 FL=1
MLSLAIVSETMTKQKKQRIVINGDVKMDTVTVYSDNQIKVTACPWMADRADEVAPDGPLRMKGCTILEPGAQMVFRPYKVGSLGSRYKQLFVTEHCTVMQTQGGVVIEKSFQEGADRIRNLGYRLESLAFVESLDPEKGEVIFK